MKTRLFLAFLAATAFLLAWRILTSASPEKQALAAYQTLEAAFQDRSLVRLRFALDDNFRVDGLGGVDEVLAACSFFFNQVEKLKISSSARVINSNPDLIELGIQARLSGTTAEGTRWSGISEEYESVSFTLVMRKRDGRWRPARVIPDRKVQEELRAFGAYL